MLLILIVFAGMSVATIVSGVGVAWPIYVPAIIFILALTRYWLAESGDRAERPS